MAALTLAALATCSCGGERDDPNADASTDAATTALECGSQCPCSADLSQQIAHCPAPLWAICDGGLRTLFVEKPDASWSCSYTPSANDQLQLVGISPMPSFIPDPSCRYLSNGCLVDYRESTGDR